MFKSIIIRVKIWFLLRRFRSIDDEAWSYYITLNYKNIKYFGGKLDIDAEFNHFRRLKEKEKYLIVKKIQELKSKLKNPDE